MQAAMIHDLISFSEDKASKVAVVDGAHCRVTLWCLDVGQEIHPHAHAGDHVWIVQEGTGWFLRSGEETPVKPGTLVFAPAGEVHGMRASSRLVFVSVSAG